MFSAVIAINPLVETEFTDENAMAEMPLGLQETVKGRQRAALGGLAVGQVTFNTYLVWGTEATMQAAIERWGADLIIMGTWNRDGTRGGTKRINVFGEDGIRTGQVVEGTPTVPLHAELLNILPDDVGYDVEGNENSRGRPADLSKLPVILGHGIREIS